MRRVKIFDTTLRDGEQSPGATMSADDKLRIALQLDEMGVDIIEAGFPIASQGDFVAVQEVAQAVEKASVCALSRGREDDIQRAWDSVKVAVHPRIHTFIATSDIHMEYKLRMSPEQVLQRIHDSVSYATSLCGDVQWSPEDATRSDFSFLCEAIDTAIHAGATTINIPDTVGYTTPEEFFDMMSRLIQRFKSHENVSFSVHCHDDLGMAVANSLAGVKAGASQVECTINGMGERAGNAALEEIVMAMRTRKDVINASCNIVTQSLLKVSRLVSSATGFLVPYNKAIVGQNAFAHESGIHQDGVIKNASTYEIMQPDDVGWSHGKLVMGKHSGRHALQKKAAELGYELTEKEVEVTISRLKELADKKLVIYDADIDAIIRDARGSAVHKDKKEIKFVSLEMHVVVGSPVEVSVVLDVFGELKTASVSKAGTQIGRAHV